MEFVQVMLFGVFLLACSALITHQIRKIVLTAQRIRRNDPKAVAEQRARSEKFGEKRDEAYFAAQLSTNEKASVRKEREKEQMQTKLVQYERILQRLQKGTSPSGVESSSASSSGAPSSSSAGRLRRRTVAQPVEEEETPAERKARIALQEARSLREMQDAEFALSLARDQQRSKLEAEREERAEKAELLRIAKEASLPPEPDLSWPGVVTVRLQCPHNKRHQRRFDNQVPCQLIIDWAWALGYPSDTYGIYTRIPRHPLTPEASLELANFVPAVNLHLEERF